MKKIKDNELHELAISYATKISRTFRYGIEQPHEEHTVIDPDEYDAFIAGFRAALDRYEVRIKTLEEQIIGKGK